MIPVGTSSLYVLMNVFHMFPRSARPREGLPAHLTCVGSFSGVNADVLDHIAFESTFVGTVYATAGAYDRIIRITLGEINGDDFRKLRRYVVFSLCLADANVPSFGAMLPTVRRWQALCNTESVSSLVRLHDKRGLLRSQINSTDYWARFSRLRKENCHWDFGHIEFISRIEALRRFEQAELESDLSSSCLLLEAKLSVV